MRLYQHVRDNGASEPWNMEIERGFYIDLAASGATLDSTPVQMEATVPGAASSPAPRNTEEPSCSGETPRQTNIASCDA